MLFRSDLVGCVTVASNKQPGTADPPPLPSAASGVAVCHFDATTVTDDQLMIMPPGWMGQIVRAAARIQMGR